MRPPGPRIAGKIGVEQTDVYGKGTFQTMGHDSERDAFRRVHFIGIGGAGMSGIALVLHQRGYVVTGSDLKASRYTRSLVRAGIDVTVGHTASTIDRVEPDVVVISTAIPESNPELKRARELGIEVSPRGGSWDEIYPHQYESPVLWGWGSNSPVEVYELNYSTGWGNYACYESATVDAYLDAALAQTDMGSSFDLWRRAMWDGAEGVAPQGAATWCWIANVDHLYFQRDGLDVADQKPHPHGHGWSLVNNVDRWSGSAGAAVAR